MYIIDNDVAAIAVSTLNVSLSSALEDETTTNQKEYSTYTLKYYIGGNTSLISPVTSMAPSYEAPGALNWKLESIGKSSLGRQT